MSEEQPASKKIKLESDEEVPGPSTGLQPDEGFITGAVSADKAKRMEDLAQKLWEKDAKKAGLEGMALKDAVIAAMKDPRLQTLPDPLAHPPGTLMDPDNWIQQGVDAGLWIEDEDCMLTEVRICEGSRKYVASLRLK